MERLKDKAIIVTGAAGGMGEAEARLFAQEGARVLATDIQVEKLEEWVSKAQKDGLQIEFIQHDVTDINDWKKVSQKAITLFGKIDGLVNNAGIFPGFFDCEQTTIDLWQKVMAINLTGPFLGCREILPHLIKNGGGTIVNIASIAGLIGGNGAAYSASKGGLIMLTKDIAVNYAKHKIRANTICPGGVKTPMTVGFATDPSMDEMIKNMSPQGRMASAIEIANGALFLISDESSFVTGTEIVMDGGAVAR